MKKYKIVVVSLFSGMDLFLFACVKAGLIPGYGCEKNIYAALMHAANFKHVDGNSLIEFIEITEEEYLYRKSHVDADGKKDFEDTTTIKDGKYIRAKTIEEINGFDIRQTVEKEYGKNVIIILIGGPPCQDLISINPDRKSGINENSRNSLMFEYLRILKELNPEVALMEQSTEIESPKNIDIFNKYIEEARQLGYRLKYLDMNAINYGGRQSRVRRVFQFVANSLNTDAVFPQSIPDEQTMRVRDFLTIDRFHSGHHCDKIKTKHYFMCTLTSGSPLWFYEGDARRHPTIDELLLCMDVMKGEYIIPLGISTQQVKKAIGNAVVVSVGYAVITTVLEMVLQLKPDGDGYWIPIDGTPDEPLPPDDGNITTALPESGGNIRTTPPRQELGVVTQPPGVKAEPIPIVTTQPGIEQVKIVMPPVRNIVLPHTVSGKIISSIELKNMQFTVLKFEGEWQELFGLPSLNFYCVIYGSPGRGKSTFAIQFANYLASNFGKTIYVSGEEGFSKTFHDKFSITEAWTDSLYVVDIGGFEDLIRVVRPDSYNFIFIDSLDAMKIKADQLKIIRATYKNSAIISISQVTKAGAVRGSNQIIHDCDVEVEVGGGGLATTNKNRFKVTGTTFNVFQKVKDIELANGGATG